ncbi:MAG: hypothetical protein ACD_20C00347G0007 [uncultured bacterium]|nr:MAG: hypothetical protein ACD_20C00347G0007 [uncultured bacterium]HBH17597.1 xanthine dehydrogenase molybdopterin binding subunit [Cyanobacteria bacterium UBA9579]
MPIVGKNIPHDSAISHVSGTSEYISDIPRCSNEIYVDFFHSSIAHGNILSINLDKAREIPGIVALFTCKDIDGHNKFGPIIQDEVLLAENKVEYVGQPIVIIAAETKKAINLAKKIIEIVIEELEPVLSIEKAMEKQQFIGATRIIEQGNIELALSNADNLLEGDFYCGGQEHLYLETQSAIAYPEENNTIRIKSSTQNPTEVQNVVAEILGIPFNHVVVEMKRMGGAFGGKESQATHPAAIAAIAASKTKRPARILLSSESDMITTGKRHPFLCKYKIGFSNEGQINALYVELFSNGGYANDLSTSILERAMFHAENTYYIPNIKIKGTVCKTNFPPNTAFRGFGAPQGILNMESIIEDIAVYLKKDSFDVRRLNCYGTKENNITPYGQEITNNTLPELLDKLFISSNYQQRVQKINEFNKKSKTRLRGISLSPLKFGISFTARFLNQASALVNIYTDGSIQVSTGGTEMGQGLNTKIKQLVADEFCINHDLVRIMTTSTEKNNNTSPTAASSGTDLNGAAALDACRKLKERLINFAGDYLLSLQSKRPCLDDIKWTEKGVWVEQYPDKVYTFNEIVKAAYLNRISLGERGFYITPNLTFSWDTAKGAPFLYFTNGCSVSEVEIDCFTGTTKVIRADILMDIGKSINPGIDRGQIAGAYIQGMGWLTTEELKYSDKGALLTCSPTTYKIPGINDIPEIFNIDWIENERNVMNVRQSKAIGEPPFVLGTSVWTAIKHALSFLANDQIVDLKAPATQEEILSVILKLQTEHKIRTYYE